MYYYGIQKCLTRKLQNGGMNGEISTINLIINIDGFPVFKSSRTDLWPILGSDDIVDSRPFIIACFCGEGKPINLEKYLKLFIEEIISL